MLYTRHCRRIITYHKYHIILTYLINHAIVIVLHTWSMEKESTPLWPRSCYQSVRRLHHEFLCCLLYFVQLTAALMYALCWYRWYAITLVYGKFRKLALQANNIPAWPGHSSMHTSCSAAIMVWLLQLGKLINRD